MSMFSIDRAVCGVSLLLLFAGCSSDPERLSPARGSVRYKSAVVRAGTIVFTPDPARGGSGPMAHAEIQPDGSFVLHTEDRPGAVPGWHRITILSVQSIDPGDGRQLWLPRRYSDPELSGLSHQIKPDQANTIDLKLE